MSDLRDQISDQEVTPTSRIVAANRPRRDLCRKFCDLLVLSSALFLCCARPPSTTTQSSVQRPEIWVDAFSQPEGDGTKEKPLKALPLQIANVDLHVRSGIYDGPFTIDRGARIEGHGEVVLTSSVTAHGATLENVTIQGGALQGGELTLKKMTFSGQRQQVIQLDGPLIASDVTFIASIEGVTGVLAKDTRVDFTNARFQGGFGRAIDVSGGELNVRSTKFEGAKHAIRSLDAKSTLTNVQAVGGSSTAFLFAGGDVTSSALEVRGYEFGVQLSRGVKAKFTDVTIIGTSQSCVSAAQQSHLELTNGHFERCGLTLLDVTSTLKKIDIKNTTELAVLIRQGTSNVDVLEVHGARGDALHIRDAKVNVDHSLFEDVDGSGLFVSAAATVTGGGLHVERASQSAVFVERGSSLTLENLLVRGGRGAAVVIPDAAKVKLGTLSVSGGNEAPIYAECDLGARMEVARIESTIEQLPSRCITARAGSKRGSGA